MEVAGFAAVDAVILAVLAEADIMLAHAKRAVAFALAFVFGLVAQHTDECISHGATLSLESERCAHHKLRAAGWEDARLTRIKST